MIIDTDRWKNIPKIIEACNELENMFVAVSNPCFEFWILLHFDYTTKLFGTSGDSPCMDLIKNNLKVFIEDYEKGDRAIMLPIIKSGLEMAVANAKRANETAKRNGTDNPTTQMDELVDYLKDLKDEK